MPAPNAIPGLKRLPKPGGFSTWYWAASQISRETNGFRPRTARLWHGRGEPSSSELASIAIQAQQLSVDLHEWFSRPERRRRARRGLIYFARIGELVKIGFSEDVERRIGELQAYFPIKLELLLVMPGSIVTEHALQRRFKAHRVHRELYRYAPPIAAFVEREQRQNRVSESPLQNVRISGGRGEEQSGDESIG